MACRCENKLSAGSHIYYNGNTTFTYAVNLKAGQTEVNLGLGAGNYEIRNLRCYIGNTDESLKTLCQSEFRMDKAQTKRKPNCRKCGRRERWVSDYIDSI